MRVTCDFKSPYYTGLNPSLVCVFLDGKHVSWCQEADDVNGECIVYKTHSPDNSAFGELICDSDGNPILVTLYGKVEIKLISQMHAEPEISERDKALHRAMGIR